MSYWGTWERLYIYFEVYSQSWMSLKYMWWSSIMYGKWWLICFDNLDVFINGRFQAFRNAALSRSFIFSLWNIYLHYFSLAKRNWQRKLLSKSIIIFLKYIWLIFQILWRWKSIKIWAIWSFNLFSSGQMVDYYIMDFKDENDSTLFIFYIFNNLWNNNINIIWNLKFNEHLLFIR